MWLQLLSWVESHRRVMPSGMKTESRPHNMKQILIIIVCVCVCIATAPQKVANKLIHA